MTRDALLAKDIVSIAEDYLGPSAPRFMERLVSNHLGTTLDQITSRDMQKLMRWTQVSTAMLTDDTKMITEFVERLGNL